MMKLGQIYIVVMIPCMILILCISTFHCDRVIVADFEILEKILVCEQRQHFFMDTIFECLPPSANFQPAGMVQ